MDGTRALVRGLDPSEGRGLYGHDPAAYDAGRPAYPERLWTVLETRCGLTAGCHVVEIGPGSGLVTRGLLSRGAEVTAVEPSGPMAAYLREHLDRDRLHVVAASFEEAALAAGACDLVVAATSFHWVDQSVGTAKLGSILRPGGKIALWWMVFEDPSRPDEFTRAVDAILGSTSGRVVEPARRPFQLDEHACRSELRQAAFVDVDSEIIEADVEMDVAQLRALYATMAVVLRRPALEQARVLDALETLVQDDFGGRVTRPFPTALYTARKP